MRPTWQEIAIALAETFSKRSADEFVKVGAVLFRPDMSICSFGYNGPPAGISPPKSTRQERLKYVVHAEANCLRWATPRDCRAGSLLASSHLPCVECIKLISSYSIPTVLWSQTLENYDLEASQRLAQELGIHLLRVMGEL